MSATEAEGGLTGRTVGEIGTLRSSAKRRGAVTGAIAAEWHKLRTVRSTAAISAVIGVGFVLCLLWSLYAVRYWDGLSTAERAKLNVAPPTQFLVALLPLCGVVLGALTLTSEYATGMIRMSLAAHPRRLPLLGAKALTASGLIGVAGLVSLTAALLAGRAIAGGRPMPGFDGPLAEHLANAAAVAVTAAALTLMTLGLAVLLRSTAATITVGLGLLFVAPPLTRLLPAPWDDRIWRLQPGGFPNDIAPVPGSSPIADGLSAPVAAALLAGYVVVMLGAGAWAFARRDA
ncbi:ABC-2 transporter permease [Actinomadura algeriensis]|uniref:ABC-type transport system involved in multi-copper enzyme maturation permease subunit n=1 Tax=Actinomadura algeriensis TaxID=1679523 RepID=A0ABR9JYL2_9ACTN|nr:ABC transporter permease [Actinomadura algeriensis]MBE1535657.1 ABC-type transport system involved in multi-copper enzyme maturation permease subunit [Actinomadura algeriensis]